MNKWLCTASFIALLIVIDTSVFMENTPLIKFIQKLHLGLECHVFHVLTIDNAIFLFFMVVWANSQFVLKYCVYHLKVKFMSSCCYVISHIGYEMVDSQ